jgi:hypothetical protein
VAAAAVALALWACALGTYVDYPGRAGGAVLTSRERTWLIVARAALPGAIVAVLAAWLAAAGLATILVTERRRVLGSKQLRLGSVLSSAT